MARAFVVTHDEARAAMWRAMTGVDRLPVLSPELSPDGAYRLDLMYFDLPTRFRIRDYLAQASGMSVEQAQAGIEADGVPISSSGCHLDLVGA